MNHIIYPNKNIQNIPRKLYTSRREWLAYQVVFRLRFRLKYLKKLIIYTTKINKLFIVLYKYVYAGCGTGQYSTLTPLRTHLNFLLINWTHESRVLTYSL
jgi:hypothetical protein